jgi:hypothetical protein
MNAVERARQNGITVLPYFFDEPTAEKLGAQFGPFGLITCTNVFAHTDNVKGFLAGVKRLLAPDGLVIVEMAHLLDIVVKHQFDVIYHEHVSYFSLRPLIRIFHECGLTIFDARKVLTQGGSLRIYARAQAQDDEIESARLQSILQEEDDHRINDLARLQRFADDVYRFRDDLRRLVTDIRCRGLRIVGLGAPAKAVILLNFCGIDAQDISYIVDSTSLKQGRFLPGTRIPVCAESALDEHCSPADYFLLLSWNFQDVILDKIAPYRAMGVRVIVPFPTLRVI